MIPNPNNFLMTSADVFLSSVAKSFTVMDSGIEI